MTPKTLRALAKAAGYQPSKIFRMKPEEVQELLKEKFDDIDSYDDTKAQELIKQLTQPKKSEEVPTKAEAKQETTTETTTEAPAKKRTRRTKAQIEADKKAAEQQTATPEATPDKKETPRRSRKKKKSSVPITPSNLATGELLVIKERLEGLEESIEKINNILLDITSFLSWYHNAKIDPREPIENLADIDWDACIDDQLKK